MLAIADGAGSAIMAERGAQLAAQTILQEALGFSAPLSSIGPEQVRRWLDAVRHAIQQEAKRLGARDTDFATTLLFAILDGPEAYLWQLGDGAWIVETTESAEVATWPFIGQYVNEFVRLGFAL